MAAIWILGVLSVTAVRAADAIPRDWTRHPAIVQVDRQPERLFAIGDVHGDYKRLVALLRRAALISPKLGRPETVQWTGGNAVLVQTGDMIDKGPHSVDVLRFMAALRRSAAANGGQVVVTMGNHEAEFLGGPNVDKAKDFIADLKRKHIAVDDVVHCKSDLGEFLCGLPFGARVGDWFFSHGGNNSGMTVAQLSRALEQGVDKEGYAAKVLMDPNSLLEARLGEGKVWFHPSEKSPDAKKSEREILTADAAALGVKHMVQGHQPGEVAFADGQQRHKGEMFQRWSLLFLIDTGMSRQIKDSKGAILRVIQNKDVTAVCPGGLETKLWDEASQPDYGRAAPCLR